MFPALSCGQETRALPPLPSEVDLLVLAQARAVLVSGSEWLPLNVTGVYHEWLRENYERRLWREDSLAYGLGIPYLAFAGKVACWNELLPDLHFRDGLGFVSVADLTVNNIDVNDYMTDAIALHWSGRRKPWGSNNFLEAAFRKPWEATVRRLGLSELVVAPMVPPPRKKAIFFTEPRSGSEWFMSHSHESLVIK